MEAAHLRNLFAGLPTGKTEESFETLVETADLRIERIVSSGQASPPGFWYDQDTAEWIVLLKGAARIVLEGGEPIDMLPGDSIDIPAHQRHRVEWTDPDSPTIWLAIHYKSEIASTTGGPGD